MLLTVVPILHNPNRHFSRLPMVDESLESLQRTALHLQLSCPTHQKWISLCNVLPKFHGCNVFHYTFHIPHTHLEGNSSQSFSSHHRYMFHSDLQKH